MTLGEKIRKYRSLNNMTQKELGMAIGFSAATADSRIRKYERDVMAPKHDIRLKLASVLDIDISALSDNDIHNEEDIMQVLFLLEEEYGITIDRSEDKTSITFDNDKKENAKLSSYLYTWYRQRRKLDSAVGLDEESDHKALLQYDRWKARFPKDNEEYWEDQREKIREVYDPIVTELSLSEKEIEKISQFIKQLRSMIQSGITIESTVKTFGPGDGGLILRFLVSEMLYSEDARHKEEFARFLFTIKSLENYGMPVYTDLLTKEQGTFICYTLRLSPIMALNSIIVKIQDYENNKEAMTDWDSEMFEADYEDSLKSYNIDFKEEIHARRDSICLI